MARTVVYDPPIIQAELDSMLDRAPRGASGPKRGARRAARKRTPTQKTKDAAVKLPTKDDYLSKLAKYVPGEVVAVSLGGFAAFEPTGNWIWFALGLGIVANVIYLAAVSMRLPATSRPRLYFYLLSAAAFVFWAAATIPQVRDKVGLDGPENAEKAAYLLVAAAFAIPAIDTILDTLEIRERPS